MKLCFFTLLLGSALAEDWFVALEMEDCWECGSDSTEVYLTVLGKGGNKLILPRLIDPLWIINAYQSGGIDYYRFDNIEGISDIECIEIDIKSGNDAWKFKRIILKSSSMIQRQWLKFINRSGYWMSADESEGKNHLRICLDWCKDDLPITNDKWELQETTFHEGTEDLIEYRPETVAEIHMDNRGSSVDQSSSFVAEKEVTSSATFEKTTGASISAGTSFRVGVPGFSGGKVDMHVGVSREFSWGEETSTTDTVGSEYSCTAAAGKRIVCKATLAMGAMFIKYTQIWKSKDSEKSGCRMGSSGIFREISAIRMNMVATEE